MKVIDPGHVYEVETLGGHPATISFGKKEVEEGSDVLKLTQDGFTNESLLEVLIDRMKFLNEKFDSPFNTEAINHLGHALRALNNRTIDREQRKVEGKHLA